MDGSIDIVSVFLLKKLRAALRGFDIEDRIILCSPHYEKTDFYIGICLYDIQDFSSAQTSVLQHTKNLTSSNKVTVRRPPKLIELGYMIFTNETKAFGSYAPEYEHRLLSEIIRVIYEDPFADAEKKTPLSLAFLSVDNKIKLWQSFTKPIQPAIYVNAGPIPIMPIGSKDTLSVKERDVKIERMG